MFDCISKDNECRKRRGDVTDWKDTRRDPVGGLFQPAQYLLSRQQMATLKLCAEHAGSVQWKEEKKQKSHSGVCFSFHSAGTSLVVTGNWFLSEKKWDCGVRKKKKKTGSLAYLYLYAAHALTDEAGQIANR